MGFWSQVWTWFTQGTHWSGATGIPTLLGRQLELSLAVVVAALIVGGGLGLLLGHYGRGDVIAVNISNAARAVPTLALLTLFAIIPAISIKWDGFLASFLALFVLATPPILASTYIGVREVDRDVKEASAAMGLSPWQVMRRVELPLAVGSIATGTLIAAIEVVATSTLAAYVSYSDLGTYVLRGLATQQNVEAFCGAVLVALTAAAVAAVFALLRHLATPSPLRGHHAGLLSAGSGSRMGRLTAVRAREAANN